MKVKCRQQNYINFQNVESSCELWHYTLTLIFKNVFCSF